MVIIAKMLHHAINIDIKLKNIISLQWLWLDGMVIRAAVF